MRVVRSEINLTKLVHGFNHSRLIFARGESSRLCNAV